MAYPPKALPHRDNELSNSFPSRVGVEATQKGKAIVVSEGPKVKPWGGLVPLRGQWAEVMNNTKL